jgi:DeoR/GlpR family transcriptional regulator of sugar metabolism
MNAVQHDTQRRIVWALVQNDGRVSYQQLDEFMTVSDRTRRKHVTTLESKDLLNRVDANFTFLEFASIEAEALIKNALTSWYNK